MNIGYNPNRKRGDNNFLIKYSQSPNFHKNINKTLNNMTPTNTYYINISVYNNMGLTNQLYILIYGICKCIHDKKNYLIVDKFLMDATTNVPSRTHINNVFYLKKINRYLYTNYALILINSNKELLFNNIVKLDNNVCVADSLVNTELGIEIFKHLYFHPNILKTRTHLLYNIIRSHTPQTRVNIIHARLEHDALLHWGKINNMSIQVFHNKIVEKYINLINQHIYKNDITIVLCSNEKNAISLYLHTNKYNYYLLPKYHNFREYNAITDMVTGKFCNNVFIGSGGSTFSHMLLRYHGDKIRYYSINLNSI